MEIVLGSVLRSGSLVLIGRALPNHCPRFDRLWSGCSVKTPVFFKLRRWSMELQRSRRSIVRLPQRLSRACCETRIICQQQALFDRQTDKAAAFFPSPRPAFAVHSASLAVK